MREQPGDGGDARAATWPARPKARYAKPFYEVAHHDERALPHFRQRFQQPRGLPLSGSDRGRGALVGHAVPARPFVLGLAVRNQGPYKPMIGAFASAPAPSRRTVVDPGLLTYRDRAALRILYREGDLERAVPPPTRGCRPARGRVRRGP